jgi:hypothetical protein
MERCAALESRNFFRNSEVQMKHGGGQRDATRRRNENVIAIPVDGTALSLPGMAFLLLLRFCI